GDASNRWRSAMRPACAGKSWNGSESNSQKTRTAASVSAPTRIHGATRPTRAPAVRRIDVSRSAGRTGLGWEGACVAIRSASAREHVTWKAAERFPHSPFQGGTILRADRRDQPARKDRKLGRRDE